MTTRNDYGNPNRKSFVFRALALLAVFFAAPAAQAQQYWNTNGSSAVINTANWSVVPTGPFTTAYSSSTDMQFTANSLVTGATVDIGNIIVDPGVTVTWTASGTLTTGGTVRTFNVGTGSILDLAGQSLSVATGTGFIKSGNGILFTSNGNTYSGGVWRHPHGFRNHFRWIGSFGRQQR